MTKTQLLQQLQQRCVNDDAIAYEFIGTEQYDPNNPNQIGGAGVVKKYLFYGAFPEGKLTARVRSISFIVQDEGGINENAFIEPDSVDGIFKGEVQSYLDTISALLDYDVEKFSMERKAATVKAAVSDGVGGVEIVRYFIEQDNQGLFSYKRVTAGDWNTPV